MAPVQDWLGDLGCGRVHCMELLSPEELRALSADGRAAYSKEWRELVTNDREAAYRLIDAKIASKEDRREIEATADELEAVRSTACSCDEPVRDYVVVDMRRFFEEEGRWCQMCATCLRPIWSAIKSFPAGKPSAEEVEAILNEEDQMMSRDGITVAEVDGRLHVVMTPSPYLAKDFERRVRAVMRATRWGYDLDIRPTEHEVQPWIPRRGEGRPARQPNRGD